MTLREVARLAGVHPGTVSRVLSPEKRSLVNEQTARRVIAAVEELGYRPNAIARGLKTNRSYTVGVFIPDVRNPVFPPLVRGIEDRLDSAGYTPLIVNTDNDAERERASFETMRSRQVDGVITATARLDHTLLSEVVRTGQRLVLLNRRVEDGTLPAVTADDRGGSRLAVEHVVSLGHRVVAHVGGAQDLSTGHQRYLGFVDATRAAGLELDERLIRFGAAYTEEEGARLCRAILDERPDVTAIVAANDLLALGCYDALAERGRRCPRDVSVVGFNDMPFADRFHPALTTVRIPHRELGYHAADLLLELISRPETPPRELLLATTLVVRASTAPARPRADGQSA